MNQYEEELQKKLEQGDAPSGDGPDAKAYEHVFRALRREPGFELPSGFAETVAARVMSQRQTRNTIVYLWYGAGILLLLTTFVVTVMMTGFQLNLGFLNGMAEYKGLALFGIAFIFVLHWLDKWLIRVNHAES